jgi:lysophospholipase L1-like esterase
MGRSSRQAALATVLLVAVTTACDAEQGSDRVDSGDLTMPASMAALGDSITRAFAACHGVGDCPQASWSTGTMPELRSHHQRIAGARGRGPQAHNFAVSGATVSQLDAQARQAVDANVEYVTVLIGANDACAPTERAMTPLDRFEAAFVRAMDTLVTGLPEARIVVVSIPDIGRLWQVGRDDPDVLARWEAFGICPSMLADAGSDSDQAQQRRSRVRDRIVGYNGVMAAACERHPTCRWDGGAVFDHDFSLEMVSPLDYWHPSLLGQRTLAEVSWNAGHWP